MRRVLLLGLLVLAACGGSAGAEGDDPVLTVVGLSDLGELDLPITTVVTELPDPRPANLTVVGDSLTVSARSEIAFSLNSIGFEVLDIDAREGRRTAVDLEDNPSGLSVIGDIARADRPELWVIALGTNDVGAQEDPDEFADDVEAVLAEIGDAPVVWLDVWIKGRIAGAQGANAALREVAAEHPNLTVVDWFQFGDDPGIIAGDGIHLTSAGRAKFAEQIAHAIALRFG